MRHLRHRDQAEHERERQRPVGPLEHARACFAARAASVGELVDGVALQSCSPSHCRLGRHRLRVVRAGEIARPPRGVTGAVGRHRSERRRRRLSGATTARGLALLPCFGMSTAIEAHGLTKRYGRTRRRRRPVVPGRGGSRHGFRGAERRREVDDDAACSSGSTLPTRATFRVDGMRYRDLRAPLSRGRRAPRRRRDASRPARAQPPALARAKQPPAVPARRRGARARRPRPTPARKRTGGFSLGMAQRLGIAAAMLGDPPRARLRRADQRARSRRHPLDPRLSALARRRGTRRARVEPPDERARGHRGRARRDRSRAADRPDERERAPRVAGPTVVSTSGRRRSPRS